MSCEIPSTIPRPARRIVSLCWISGCDSTVRLGNWEGALRAMSGEATPPVASARPAAIFSVPLEELFRMKRPIVAFSLAAFALCATPLVAQSADSLIAKYIQASGGMDRMQAIQTLRRTGKFTGGGGFEAVVVQENKRPNSVREEFSLQGMTTASNPP